MTKHRLISAILLTLEMGLLSSCGLIQDSEDTREPGWNLAKPSDPNPETPLPAEDHPLADFVTCGADLDWVTPNDNYWLDPGFFGFSPNDGLLLKHDQMDGMSSAFSTRDGTLLTPDAQPISGLTDSGLMGVVANSPTLRVISTITGEDITRLESTGFFQEGAISNDGSKVAAVACSDNDEISVNLYDGPTLRMVDTLSISPGPCYRWQMPRWHLQFSPSGEHLVFSANDEIHFLNVATGEEQTLVAHGDSIDEEFTDETLLYQRILDLKFSPDGTRIASTGIDGLLKVHLLSTLELVAEYRTTPHRVNIMTYAPIFWMAPIAWGPDNQTLAFLQDENIVVTDGTEELRLEMPELEGWDPNFPRNLPALMEFSHDGRQLAVAAEAGVAMFGCEAQRPQEPNTIRVLLEGPSEAKVQEHVTLTATHVGELEIHAHQFRVNGVPLRHSTERELQWTPTEAGVHEIEVDITNGIKSGTTSIQIIVSE